MQECDSLSPECKKLYQKYLKARDGHEKTVYYADFVNCMKHDKMMQRKERKNAWRF